MDFRAFFSLILILISPLHAVSCAEKASINGRSVGDESTFCIRFDDDSDKCIFASGEFNNSRKNTNGVVSATECSNCTRLAVVVYKPPNENTFENYMGQTRGGGYRSVWIILI